MPTRRLYMNIYSSFFHNSSKLATTQNVLQEAIGQIVDIHKIEYYSAVRRKITNACNNVNAKGVHLHEILEQAK